MASSAPVLSTITTRRVAKADLAGELGMARGHESRHFFVAHLDVVQILGLFQRHVVTAHPVARVAVDAVEAPFLQTVPHISLTFMTALLSRGIGPSLPAADGRP